MEGSRRTGLGGGAGGGGGGGGLLGRSPHQTSNFEIFGKQ